MKGTTHLAIGVTIGMGAAAYFPFSFKSAGLYVAISAFSALSADLDGPSLLSRRIGQLSRWIRESIVWLGAVLVAGLAYQYVINEHVNMEWTMGAFIIFLLGFITKEGIIRNAIVSLIGAVLMFIGWQSHMYWLIGFGLFVAWAPWLSHRGLTHTIWAVIFWGMIGYGLEQQLQVEGIMAVSVLGYVSHLVADTLTPRGVKWFYPLYKKSIRL
ncbi:metal-dependent hydrolase [Paenibacillus arenosi]|uniref:Metal-dependent hydrolase n=1 Tax=Paenibacillus arenosi TaxID=2774142 RepID=A0ABR9ATJ9_9BACL|nr:metal-dependent hydrolase [Paenibacillus arenosi]MBD8497216.1 metal-dependent hydrolase [Paenibacillus arenosi]